MAYTDDQIADYARQLGTKGASPAEIETFVSDAKASQTRSTQSTTMPASQARTGTMGQIGRAVVDAGLEGGGAALGQTIGAAGGPLDPVTIPVGGAIGGMAGNYAAQQRRMSMGEQDKFKYGQFLGAGAMGLVPGLPYLRAAKAGLPAVKQGLVYAGANLGSKALETGIDEGRAPTTGETVAAGALGMAGPMVGATLDQGREAAKIVTKQIQNSVRDATLSAARQAGYVISPSKVNPGTVNNLLESIAGKAATVQEVAIRNQEITNALAKKAIGLPPSAPITEASLRQVREAAAAPYREIESFARQAEQDLAALQKSKFTAADPHELAVQMADPATVKETSKLAIQAGADVNALKKARFDATTNFQFFHRSGDPKALEAATTAETLAGDLEAKIEKAAIEMGKPELAAELKLARTRIAKAYQVEKALNLGDSNVSAPILGRSIDKGAPLTGDLATIAKFQQAQPQAMREGASVPSPGVNKLKVLAGAALGAGGYGAMGMKGAALAAIPFMEGPARGAILSGPYQKLMAKPAYGVPQADFLARFGRNSTESLGRNPFLQFLGEAYPAK